MSTRSNRTCLSLFQVVATGGHVEASAGIDGIAGGRASKRSVIESKSLTGGSVEAGAITYFLWVEKWCDKEMK